MEQSDIESPTIIDLTELLESTQIKFFRVTAPVFLDHSGECRVVDTNAFDTRDDLVNALNKPDMMVYVYQCLLMNSGPLVNKYVLRWVVAPSGLAPLLTEFDFASGYKITQGTGKPVLPGTFSLDTDAMCDLQRHWGRDELVRQLGEYLVQGVETRHFNGIPEIPTEDVHVRTGSVDPHSTST